ncbi:MAG: YheU family protein [Gammaproteobacteria bacterium]|uniref:YheU family protein n=1 Tax=Pseudomaricurvus alcaniphilus TaxID=1166482 RepID=UPI00140738E8|nr:YheU family protein [Pseudomaricurvus alcaniphilus]MBR9912506.1 YheU family protein [Gammaproteobacteria bacterium]NHN36287.1 YheU family protein [Pseudomaricurvus alcaniphilus]
MIIPHQQLSAAALQGLIEEFITREGTDYGDIDMSLAEKVAQVMAQVQRGEVVVAYDQRLQTATLMTQADARALEREQRQS